tara:strand:+ start:89954 stop:90256 length:303 start_codon:yes stop_codon:yes gene_type:complete
MLLAHHRIEIDYNPDFVQLADLYDELERSQGFHKYSLLIKFKNKPNMILKLQRKYTYKGNRVIKTNYLHGMLYILKDGVYYEHTEIKQTKTGFNTASYYK